MAASLIPQFGPLHFAAECALPGEKLFEPATAQGGSMLVAGGPQALGLFTVHDRSSALRTFRSKAGQGIAGFCVNDGTLYIQDGPVISGWTLLTQKCIGAQNLSKSIVWDPNDTDDGATEPPEWFYEFSEEDAELHDSLKEARTRHALAASLAELELHGAADANEVAKEVRMLLRAGEANANQLFALAGQSLEAAVKKAAKVVYSAPVARTHQVSGSAASQVFCLGLNGTIYAMDAALTTVSPVTPEAGTLPLRAEIALAEPLLSSGNYGCRLYYVTEDGAINVRDGSKPNLDALPGWSAAGKVNNKDAVLPLACHGKLLMGGGILGADFFVTGIDPESRLAQTVAAPAGGWRHYAVEPGSELVVLSNGTATRLHAYGARVTTRDRWGLRQSAAPVHVAFARTGTAAGDYPLVLETDVVKPANAALKYRFLLANTVDCLDQKNHLNYPPPALVLDEGEMGPWNGPTPFSIAWIRNIPAIAGPNMYCVVRAALPPAQTQVGTGIEPGFSAGSLRARLQTAGGGAGDDLKANGRLPLLRAGGSAPDAVAAFALNGALSAVKPKIAPGLAAMEEQAKSVRARVTLTWSEVGLGINPTQSSYGPSPVRSARLRLSLTPGGIKEAVTDANGVFYLDFSAKKCAVTLVPGSYDGLRSGALSMPHDTAQPQLTDPSLSSESGLAKIDRPTYTRSATSVTLGEGTEPTISITVIVQTNRQ